MFNTLRYIDAIMIKSFHCKDTQSLFEGKCPRRFKAVSTQFWLNLQTSYDLKITEKAMSNKINEEVPARLVA